MPSRGHKKRVARIGGAQRVARTHACAGLNPRTDLPDRLFFQTAVQPLLKIYSGFPKTQITSISVPFRPTRGAYRDRHGRGAECGGRGSVGHDT